MNLSSGYSQDANNQFQERYIKEIMVTMGVFTDDAVKLSGLYSLHSGRNYVTKEDMELALKTRAYYGDHFWNRSDIQQRINEMRTILEQSESESESESEQEQEQENEEEKEEPFIQSMCNCELCTTLNEVKEKWKFWKPENHLEIVIKNSVDETFPNII